LETQLVPGQIRGSINGSLRIEKNEDEKKKERKQ
jgi:hypothetical protein